MELDALKKTLNNLTEQTSSEVFSRDVRGAIALPSSGYIARMKRNLLRDFCMTIAGMVYLIIFYAIKYEGELWLCAVFFAITSVAVSVYFFKKKKLLNDMQHAGLKTTHFLEKQLTTLRKYVDWYIIGGTLFLPVSILLVFIMANLYQPALLENKNTILYWLSSDASRWTSFAGLLTLTAAAYYTCRWYAFKLYGRHIGRLFSLLMEMNEK
jgi:drug/metabolite transporter (DMT)-like permease